MMHNEARASTFEPYIGQRFRIALGQSGSLELSLSQVNRLPSQPHAPRPEPFTLLFLGPDRPILPQATYALTLDAVGTMEIFIVPVGPDSRGRMQYEAVFN